MRAIQCDEGSRTSDSLDEGSRATQSDACLGQIDATPSCNGMYTFQSASKVACNKCLSADQECTKPGIWSLNSNPNLELKNINPHKLSTTTLNLNSNPDQTALNLDWNLNPDSDSHITRDNNDGGLRTACVMSPED